MHRNRNPCNFFFKVHFADRTSALHRGVNALHYGLIWGQNHEKGLSPLHHPTRAVLFLLFVHSRPQRHDFWHRKSAIHGLPATLRMLRLKSTKFDWFWSQSIVFTKPFRTGISLDQVRGSEVAILDADQKERNLWGRECSETNPEGRRERRRVFSSVDCRLQWIWVSLRWS